MPSGSRTRPKGPPEIEDDAMDTETQQDAARLQFDEPLSWRAGRPIAVAELLRRLETLWRELRATEQDWVERESMKTVVKELASSALLAHKDRGVRAWSAACLVEILRLHAPDAPYTGKELKEIFSLFIQTILPALSDPSNPYNAQHLYTLKSLAEVKSIVLLPDIPSSGNLIHNLFAVCFDVLSGPSKADSGEELSKNVEHHMTTILSALVDESASLPSEVIDTILAQFLRADPRLAANASVTKSKKATASAAVDDRQSTLLLKEAPPAYNMAKNICNTCVDKMARYVTRYFGSVITDVPAMSYSNGASSGKKSHRRRSDEGDDDDDDAQEGPSSEDWKEIDKAHSLMRELWRSTPSVLQDIIPSMENEVQSSNLNLRLLAVETIGDMVSGIGKGGPPPPTPLNPLAYPSQSLELPPERTDDYNFLTTPTSPISFVSRYHQVYEAFLSRRNDKSPVMRAAWVTAIGRIIKTSAGGVGLDADEESRLLRYIADCLRDADEKVRYNAVRAVDNFDYTTILQKMGGNGGVSEEGSVLFLLAERAKDRRPIVHREAIQLLGRIWGVAAGAIAEGSERTAQLLGPIPSKIFEAYYINSPEISALIDRTIFQSMLPLNYPPIKPKQPSLTQPQQDSQSSAVAEEQLDPDKIRAERALVLIKGLQEKAKAVIFSQAARQTSIAKIMTAFLAKCEQYNGGVMDSDEKEIKGHLSKIIDVFSKMLPEPNKASEDLWKFAKMHDRRSYQLIRFCMDPASDYRKVQKAIKELFKRLEEAVGSNAALIDTISTLVYRCSILLYNRSHVPAIIQYSRTDEKGLGGTAHEVLKEISKNKSEAFKAHIQDLCKSLESEAATAKKPNIPGAVDDLKACAEFARKFPNNVPKERKFIQALLGFIEHGQPPKAAKFAVFILLTVAEKKQMYVRSILESCTQHFRYGEDGYLRKLAALSQLVLVGAKMLDAADADAVVDVAINQVLTNDDANPSAEDGNDPLWEDSADEHCQAKMLALKVLVNRIRGCDPNETIEEAAELVISLLNKFIRNQDKRRTPLPAAHVSRLRLLAAQSLLKLCCERRFNDLLSATAFNALGTISQDPCAQVRAGFVTKLMKYLGQNKLPKRFYAYLFLLAFEPTETTKDSTVTWLKSRALAFARAKDTAMEALFARFLSLLAHHPDFAAIPKDSETYISNLQDFAKYIMFYLLCVANPDNLSLIYHVAQRVKSVRDGIDADKSDNLYVMSDLAQATIRAFQEQKGWSLPAWPGKVGMPSGIFKSMPDHETAQEVAMTQYLPEAMVEDDGGVDDVVKEMLRAGRKRKHDGKDGEKKKKPRVAGPTEKKERKERAKKAKTPKKNAKKFLESDDVPSSDRRKSGRTTARKQYTEMSDEDEDEENGVSEMEREEEEDDQSGPGAEPSPDKAESEEEPEPEPEPEEPEEPESEAEPEPPPPRARRGGRTAVKQEPKPAKITKSNGVSKRSPKPKSKSAATKKLQSRGKGKAAQKEKDVYDISSDTISTPDISD